MQQVSTEVQGWWSPTYPEALKAARDRMAAGNEGSGARTQKRCGRSLTQHKRQTYTRREYNRMMRVEDCVGVLLQPMVSGTQLFVGAKRKISLGIW